MAQVAIITDTHFGARNDLPALQQSMSKFYSDIFFPTLDKFDIKHVLHGGDYMDRRKYVNFNTARMVFEHYRRPMRARRIHETIIIGNHDAYLKHTNDINGVDELCRDDDSITIVKHPAEMEIAGCDFLMLPWICDDNRVASEKLIATSRASLVLGHLQLAGFQMYRGHPNEDGMDAKLFDRFESVMSGHYHHKSQSGPIQYLGAPYPMTWQDYHDVRGFHLFDTDTHKLTFIDNPNSLFHRIIYDDENKKFEYIEQLVESITSTTRYRETFVKVVVRTKTQPYWFELLMDALYKVSVLDVVIVDDIIVNDDDTETRSFDDLKSIDTLALIGDYVDGLSISCDKSELKGYLGELYREAMDADQSARIA